MLLSPGRRRTTRGKDKALERNAMRRQASSDMLGAMRTAARRNAPERAKSSAGALQRRPPARTKSGVGLEGVEEGKPAPRRRPPPRTKSGDGLGGASPRAPRRKPPERTKSGDMLAPAAEEATVEVTVEATAD
jgi:hypothetical protein